jgi:transcriptional regulator with XRE-family HTH domain
MSVAEAVDWIPEDTFAARLALVRVHRGWRNVKAAADACGITRQNWSNWEGGKMPRDTLAVCRKIAAVAGCDVRWLAFGGELQKLKFLMWTNPNEVQGTLPFTRPALAQVKR